MSDKFSFRGGDTEGVPDGDYVLTVAGGHVTGLAPAPAGGGTGTVETIVPGTGITVDDTDPANPVVSATGGGGGGGGTAAQSYVGKNVAGATSIAMTTRQIIAKRITLAAAGLLTDVEAYLDPNSSSNVHAFGGGVWADASGLPGHLLTANMNPNVSTGFGGASATPRWIGVPLGRWLAAGSYWIGFQYRFGATTPWKIAYDTGGSDRTATTSGDWLTDLNSATADSTRDYSIRGNLIVL